MIMWWWCWTAAQASEPAPQWALGVGVRESFIEEGFVDGAKLIAQRRSGRWSGELSAYASPWAARYSGLASILVQLAEGDYQHPVDHDRASLSALGAWHAWEGGGRGGSPVFYAGADVQLRERSWLWQDGSSQLLLQPPEQRVEAGPTLGAGFEVELGRLVSRLVVTDRMRIAPPTTYSPDATPDGLTLHHEATLSLDVLIRLGGGQ